MKLNVKDKMIEKKINRNQFAKLVQIGYPAACAIYDGSTTRISFDTLESICRVPVSYTHLDVYKRQMYHQHVFNILSTASSSV